MKKIFTPTPEDEYLRKHFTAFVLALLTSMLIVMALASLFAWIAYAISK